MKQLVCIVLSLLLCPYASAEKWISISELREQVPSRWTETYQTKWRDISIDAEVIVPQVDKIPVVLVGGGATEPVLTAEEAGWDEIEFRGPYDILLINHVPAYPKKVDGKRVGSPTSQGNWYSGFAPENQYIPLDDVTFGEITAQAKAEIAKFGYDPEDWALDDPRRLWTHHVYAKGTKEDILPGYMYMEVRAKVAGIPVMSHIWDAVVSHHGTNRNDEFWLPATSDVAYNGYLGGISHIYLTPLMIKTVLEEDVPLCSFEKVLAAVESEIADGHIRKIYEIELGYVLYNEPGVYRKTIAESDPLERKLQSIEQAQSASYYLRPMWQVNCLYVEKATGKLRDVSGYTDDERNSIDYYQLLIDAQTGEMVEQTNAKDRCEFKGVLSWEQAENAK